MENEFRIRVLVVDDEPLAREKVRTMVAGDPEVEIVGECANGAEAIAAVAELAPDLLLLDVQMPEADGFSVLKALGPERAPLAVFVTAYDHYAVSAFEHHALDYLLKPYDRERFNAALARVKERLRRGRAEELDGRVRALLAQLEAGAKHLERLVVKTGGRVFFLPVEEIDWVEAEGNYVNVHTAKKSHMLRETISSLEAQLDPRKFVRIHRSTVVNLARVRELQSWSHGEYRVILYNGKELTLSRNYRENLQAALGNAL